MIDFAHGIKVAVGCSPDAFLEFVRFDFVG
nr:MAG TPA: hypothetical protein [Caudoviricetes sp.]DAY14083.1 MAG TPA: hypothetical protein [Caudoviricetes sp.]